MAKAKKKTGSAVWDVAAAQKQSDSIPLEVKAVAVWRSSDRHLLGYYPGIFGPNRWGNYALLLPALAGSDFYDLDTPATFASAEAALHAWAHSQAVPLDTQRTYNTALSDHLRERISGAGLYRDARASAAVDNPFEESETEDNAENT